MLNYYYENADYCIQYAHTKDDIPAEMDFHLHDRFEIYFFVSGNVNYIIEKNVHSLKHGDLLIMNSHEIHKPSFQPSEPYERIVIHFDPSVPRIFNTSGFDLLDCFINRPRGEQNKINLSKAQIEEVLALLEKIKIASMGDHIYLKTLKFTYFIELLVYINKVFTNIRQNPAKPDTPEKLAPILDYIDDNLDGDLTLRALEHKFFINRFYLCRLFKKSTGSSLHEYIICKRISKAKKLLSEGFSVTETSTLCGFDDYSNFLRMFKRKVGVSPGQYKKESRLFFQYT